MFFKINSKASTKTKFEQAFLLLSFIGLIISFLQYFDFWNIATFLCLVISLTIYLKEKFQSLKAKGNINYSNLTRITLLSTLFTKYTIEAFYF